jgi:hypothetical protein
VHLVSDAAVGEPSFAVEMRTSRRLLSLMSKLSRRRVCIGETTASLESNSAAASGPLRGLHTYTAGAVRWLCHGHSAARSPAFLVLGKSDQRGGSLPDWNVGSSTGRRANDRCSAI